MTDAIIYEVAIVSDSFNWCYVLDHEPDVRHKLNTASEAEAINKMLADGWQLVSVIHREPIPLVRLGGTAMYFQRPRAVQP